MMKYEIESADNGWIISWWDEIAEGEYMQHHQVFEVPDNCDTDKGDPMVLIDLLLFVKEEICGHCYSKHKTKNIIVQFEVDVERGSNGERD